jgi:chromosome segregation ATPase
MGLNLYCATSYAQYRYTVMLRSGNAHAGIAATTSTTKGGEDITNSQSELDSLPDTDDESQGSESDTESEEHHSEDHHSDEDVTSTSTTDSEMEYDEEPCSDVINCDLPDVKILAGVSKLRVEVRNASSAVRSEVFRLRKENKELRGQICNSRMKYNDFYRTQKKEIIQYQVENKGMLDIQGEQQRHIINAIVEFRQLRASRDDLQQALQHNISLIQQKEQELDQVRGAHREITKELEEVQQALKDLRKLQAINGRGEYNSIQDSSAMQELQLSKIARDLRKESEMEQLRDSLRKLNEDYKSLQGPSATRELQQSRNAHESNREELEQIKNAIEKLASDYEKLREQIQGTSSRSKDTAKQVGPSAETRVDNNKAKGSRSLSNHAAMHADVQHQQS